MLFPSLLTFPGRRLFPKSGNVPAGAGHQAGTALFTGVTTATAGLINTFAATATLVYEEEGLS